MKLTKTEARRLIISASGLHKSIPFGTGLSAVQRAIRHLGYVQIDTISVVERAHHHVLASRIPGYQIKYIDHLQKQAKILEYWSHAAAYLPMEDYRYTLPLKQHFRDLKDRWPKSDQKIMAAVLERIRQEGPLMARDFENPGDRNRQGWWDWKPAKLALERLFFQGSLVTIGRKGFQKIYDLPENYIPSHVNVSTPSENEYADYLINRALRSHGIVSFSEMTYLQKVKKHIADFLNDKLKKKEIQRVDVEGVSGGPYFIDPSSLEQPMRLTSPLKILSPFDNLTIQRNRLRNFFDYEYQIECYVPSSKRIYGYFCLPILNRDHFIGRVDIKADRKNSALIINNIFFENEKAKDVPPVKYSKAIIEFAEFNQCPNISVKKSSDDLLTKEIMLNI